MSSNSDNTSGLDRTSRVINEAAKKIRTTPNGSKPTTVPDEDVPAPDVAMSPSEAPAMPWLMKPTVKPHLQAGPRDYLDRPSTLAGIERLYDSAKPSFSTMQTTTRAPERLVPIDPEGNLEDTSMGDAGRDQRGAMHVKTTIPKDSMAIIHSHPRGQSAQPSDDDYNTANKVGAPNFNLTQDAIYVAEPGGGTKRPIKVADLSDKGGHLKISWSKDNPVITDKTPVYDRGGDVNVNDGRHQLAILEHGERVLKPEEANMYREQHGLPKIKLYDEGGDVDTSDTKPREMPNEEAPLISSDVSDQLIPEPTRGTPEERAAIKADKQNGMGQGINGLTKIGLAKIHENHLEPTAAESTEAEIAPRSSELPKNSTEMHQDVAGSPLVNGAPTSYDKDTERDFAAMKHKAQLADYDKKIAAALDEASPEGQEKADRLSLAKQELIHRTPWGSEANHPGILGKIGHVAEMVGSRFPVSSEIMAQIPGTEAFRNAQHNGTLGRIQAETPLTTQREAQDVKESPKPKLLTGEDNVRTDAQGEREQRYEMPDGSTQWVPEGQTPSAGRLGRISVPQGSQNESQWTYGKDKPNTHEQNQNRYAELRNKITSGGQLSEPEQNELRTLQTQFSVGPDSASSVNNRIDSILQTGKVPQSDWKHYHVSSESTQQELKDAETEARAYANEVYTRGAEARQEAKEQRKQDEKDKRTTVYVEDKDGNLVYTSRYDAERNLKAAPNAIEEVKPSDITKDKNAIRQLNDVQKNISRYEESIASDLPKITPAEQDKMREILALQEQSGGSLLSVDGKGLSLSSLPIVGAKLTKQNFEQASSLLKSLTPAARSLMNNYLRTAAAVPAYQKALTGIGRSNKEMLELELANVPMPYYDNDTMRTRMRAFQENVDQAKSGFPKNLPGLHLSGSESKTDQAPPVSTLKEGVHTTFNNGQTWTLQNGKPVQVNQ